jgi:L-rhamnose mutarotase
MTGDRRRLVLPQRRPTVNQKFMIRKCFVMQLKHGAKEEYRQRHGPIWKELEDVLLTHGVHNYSIALHSELQEMFHLD